MDVLGALVRWLHVAALATLVGGFAGLLLVVRPASRAAGAAGTASRATLDRTILALVRVALLVTLGAATLDLWRQVAVATGGGLVQSLDAAQVVSVLLDTRYGAVWIARVLLLVLLGGLLALADDDHDEPGWVALRTEGLALSAAALFLGAAAGHAAAAEPTALSVILDALHLLATGLWAGGLAPLLLCLGWARRFPPADARAVTIAAVAGFSRLGLAAMAILVATGAFASWQQVGGVPGLLGTPYGRWLGVKLLLVSLVLGLAARNLLAWRPRLAASGEASAAAAAGLRRGVWLELGLVAAILGVVSVLGLTTPGRHSEIVWPLSFRLDWGVAKSLPGAQPRVAIGSQMSTLGLVALLLAVVVRPRRWRVASLAGAIAIVLGAGIALPPLAIDASPATYLRPSAPYTATSVVAGHVLYRTHCQACHGIEGLGDGPAAATLPRRPADLTARHTGDHTAGDLFWWLTHGIPGSRMPAFADRMSAEERWDAINFVRALGAADQGRTLGPIAESRPAIVAPDFAFGTGVGDGRTLRDWRGTGVVLLVFFTLPESAERLVRLSELSLAFRLRSGVVIGVPMRDARDVYRALGDRPVHFPIAVDGAAEAAEAYGLFRRDLSEAGQRPAPPPAPHMEVLVDRQGYLRARWIPRDVRTDTGGWADPARLLGEVDRLSREVPSAPLAAEHVH